MSTALVWGSISNLVPLKHAKITLVTINCSIKTLQFNKCPIRAENNSDTFSIICYVDDFALPLESNTVYLSLDPSLNCRVFASTATANLEERKEHCEAKLKRDDLNQCYTATFCRVFIRKATRGPVCFAIKSSGVTLFIREATFTVRDGSDPARRQDLNNQITNTAAGRRSPRTKLLGTDHGEVTLNEFMQPTKPRATLKVKYLEDLDEYCVFTDGEITPILIKGPDYLIIELLNLEPGVKTITLNNNAMFGTITINYQSPVATMIDCLDFFDPNVLPYCSDDWVPAQPLGFFYPN